MWIQNQIHCNALMEVPQLQKATIKKQEQEPIQHKNNNNKINNIYSFAIFSLVVIFCFGCCVGFSLSVIYKQYKKFPKINVKQPTYDDLLLEDQIKFFNAICNNEFFASKNNQKFPLIIFGKSTELHIDKNSDQITKLNKLLEQKDEFSKKVLSKYHIKLLSIILENNTDENRFHYATFILLQIIKTKTESHNSIENLAKEFKEELKKIIGAKFKT